jgi:hypothetical protein
MASQNPDEAPKRLSSDESLWGEQESKRKRGGPAFGVRVDQLSQDEPGGGTLTTPTAPFPAPQRRWRLRRVDLLIGAAALVLLLVGFLLGLAVRPERPPPAPARAAAPVTVTSLAPQQVPPPRACLVAMERADAAIAYLVGNIRDQRLSDTIQEFVESRRACQAAMR